MTYVITYVSYKTYSDREVYYDKETADKRFSFLEKCKVITKLQMKERD